jgi:hypothetical protein
MSESFASIITLIAIAIGMFYVVGGIVHMRALVLDSMADELFTMLGDGEASSERLRTRAMMAGAALTFASGLSLLALSRWTLPIFAVNTVLQGAYLLWVARASPPQDDAERHGRRATLRAFFNYIAALGFVVGLDRYGLWRIWLEPALAELAAIAAPAIALSWFFQQRSSPASKATSIVPPSTSSEPRPADAPNPECLRLAPEYHCAPLWDDECGNMVDPASLGLSAELLQRIADWDASFQATFNEDDPFASGFTDVAAEHAWVKKGNAIVEDLGKEWPGSIFNGISGLTKLVRDFRHDLGPWDELPEERLAAIGEKCGVAEIEAAIVWLDELSREGDALPEWDGDSQDDIARARETLHRILARVPGRYIEIVASGLHSPEWRTRVHIAMALAGHDRTTALPSLRDALAREEDETAHQLITMTLANAESERQ